MDRIKFKAKVCGYIKEAFRESYNKKDITQEVELNVPNLSKYGAYSTNFCLRVSSQVGETPRKVAEKVRNSLEEIIKSKSINQYLKEIKVEGPGFLNFYLTEEIKLLWLKKIYEQSYFQGLKDRGKGRKVSVEFVSANPTGPLTVAHARQAVVGDSLCNILEFCGYEVIREYYINDEGRQIELLGESVKTRCLELLNLESDIPCHGYKGDYILDIAKGFMEKNSKQKVKDDSYDIDVYAIYAVENILSKIKEDLQDLGVYFNKWPRQSEITSSDRIREIFEELEEKDYFYKKEGAVWFESTLFGDNKDRVVIKKDGEYTYFAPDIVYHNDKLKENDKNINIWGPDHHGYIPRLKAAVEALGYNPELLDVLLVQLTIVYKDGEPLSMSKREGEFISLKEILDAIGKDITRFFLLMRTLDSHLDFDLELAKKSSMDNPVYYVQYAHARICSIFKNAMEKFGSEELTQALNGLEIDDLKCLTVPEEKEIINHLLMLPDEILICINSLEPYRIVDYLKNLASKFHKFYAKERVLSEDKKITLRRLFLCKCIREILDKGLNLLGIEVPETM